MFLELCFVVTFLSFLKFFVFKSRVARIYEEFPGPKSYPIIGSIMEFEYPKVEVTETLKRFSFQYGPVYLFWMGRAPMVCLRNPSDVEAILRSTTDLEKAPGIYYVLLPWLNQGLITSNADIWRRHRKILTPAFHFKILETFIPVFVRNAHILMEKFSKIVGQDYDVVPNIELCSMDIIVETAMGIKVNAQLEESKYVNTMRELTDIIAHRNFHLLQRTPLFEHLPTGKRHNELVKYLQNFTDCVIKQRKDQLALTSSEKNDINADHTEMGIKEKKVFIDMLLQYTSEGAAFSDSEIREEVDTFIFAGLDTTSSAIAFCLYNLSQNQDVQETAYEEIRSILGDRDPSYEDLMQMKYLGNVIKETLRIFPPVPIIGRQTSKDMQLHNGYVVPANTSVVVLIEAMNHDPVTYPDPHKFDPLRFDRKPDNPYAFVPFSAGSRNCIGQKYAILETKAVVALVLRKFRLLPSNIPITPWFSLILKSKSGIHMKLEHRKSV